MDETVHALDYTRNGSEPLVGALLRRPFMSARHSIIEALHAAGFTDVLAAHLAVFQHPGPHGRSPSDVARAAGASKQAMNNLLTQLERGGYLTREVNPDNRRERTIELTERGHTVIGVCREAAESTEQRWAEELGDADFAQLRALLVRLNAGLAE
jgi:DNA-binding MarR family transcriptional regulator